MLGLKIPCDSAPNTVGFGIENEAIAPELGAIGQDSSEKTKVPDMTHYFTFGPFLLSGDGSRLEREGHPVSLDRSDLDFLLHLVECKVKREPNMLRSGIGFFGRKSEQSYYGKGKRVAAALGQSGNNGPYLAEDISNDTLWTTWDFVAAVTKATPEAPKQQADAHAGPSTKGTPSPRDTAFEYKVGLSFAGEDRKKAQRLAEILKESSVTVFYDDYETHDLWGKDLCEHFAKVYGKQCEFCVIFVSQYYKEKLWTRREFREAQARSFRDKREYILPVRLDDTELDGLPETIGYLDLRRISIEAVAAILIKKINHDI